jgi:hypothetical protein
MLSIEIDIDGDFPRGRCLALKAVLNGVRRIADGFEATIKDSFPAIWNL